VTDGLRARIVAALEECRARVPDAQADAVMAVVQSEKFQVAWEFRYGDGEHDGGECETKEGALRIAARYGYEWEGDGAVCWRYVGRYHDGEEVPA